MPNQIEPNQADADDDDDAPLPLDHPLLIRMVAVFRPALAFAAGKEGAPARCPRRKCRTFERCLPLTSEYGFPQCQAGLSPAAYDLATDVIEQFDDFFLGGRKEGDIGFLPCIRGKRPLDEALAG